MSDNLIPKDINDLGLDSFFSSYVKEIVQKLSSNESKIIDVLDSNLCLNWSQIQDLIPDKIEFTSELSEETIDKLSNISALIESIGLTFSQMIDNNMDSLCHILEPNLFWTQELRKTFIESIKIIKQNINNDKKSVNNILSLQLISCCCEQSLGNLVLTAVPFVPPLLKDLLTLEELERIVGQKIVMLLQLTMGSPITLNIRNLLWHGFVAPEDIDQRFGSFLLCICATIGRDLDQSFHNKSLPQRPLHVISSQVYEWKSLFPILNSSDLRIICDKVLDKSPFILRRMTSLWKYALELYENQYFGHSIAVLFPQLESCLRFIYCSVNGIPSKLMTAIAKQYYLTFAEILSPTLPDCQQINSLHILFGQSFIELLLDLIIIPDGPRIRDKLSHGQIDIFLVEGFVANHILCASVCALVLADIKLFNKREYYSSFAIIQEILNIGSKYRNLFHPLSQLRAKIISFDKNISQLNEISFERTSSKRSQNNQILGKQLNQLIGFNEKKSISQKLDEINLNILTNPKTESEIIILHQIVDNMIKTCNNIQSFLILRANQIKDMKLRSRQRANYYLMLDNIHIFKNTFTLILWILFLLFTTDLKLNESENSEKILKSLRFLVSFCENLNSNTNLKVNKWDKCYIICENIALLLIKMLTDLDLIHTKSVENNVNESMNNNSNIE